MPAAYPAIERLTKGARATLRHAYIASWELHQAWTEPDHILLGLLAVPYGIAATVLRDLGVTQAAARRAVATHGGRPGSHLPSLAPTRAAYQVVVDAVAVADHLHHHYVGTEHLLLGLMRTHDTVVQDVMGQLGLRFDAVETRVLGEMRVVRRP